MYAPSRRRLASPAARRIFGGLCFCQMALPPLKEQRAALAPTKQI